MSKHLYKQYLRLVSKWPKDTNKAPQRDFANFLGKEVEAQFQAGQITPIDNARCERRLNALDQLLNNEVLKKYPNNYSSGVFGLRLEVLQKASSEESRKEMGLKPKENFIKKIWSSVFQKKK